MGAMQNNEKGSQKSKKVRGSVRNDNRLSAFANANSGDGADWGACAPERIQTVVVAITGLGGAVTFGLSRDKGAHSLTLLLDHNRETLWFNGGADLDEELDGVAATLSTLT